MDLTSNRASDSETESAASSESAESSENDDPEIYSAADSDDLPGFEEVADMVDMGTFGDIFVDDGDGDERRRRGLKTSARRARILASGILCARVLPETFASSDRPISHSRCPAVRASKTVVAPGRCRL